MSIYTTTDKCRAFSGEIESDKDIILVDELTCEHLPFKVVKRDLNKELKFCSTKVLTEYLTNLRLD